MTDHIHILLDYLKMNELEQFHVEKLDLSQNLVLSKLLCTTLDIHRIDLICFKQQNLFLMLRDQVGNVIGPWNEELTLWDALVLRLFISCEHLMFLNIGFQFPRQYVKPFFRSLFFGILARKTFNFKSILTLQLAPSLEQDIDATKFIRQITGHQSVKIIFSKIIYQ